MPRIRYERARDVEELVEDIVACLGLDWIDVRRLHFVRSHGSRSKAYARIYGVPRIFQVALGLKPLYIIEVVSENFDKLGDAEKIKVLIHELMHIPRSFSGGLRPHGKYTSRQNVEKLFKEYLARKRSKNIYGTLGNRIETHGKAPRPAGKSRKAGVVKRGKTRRGR
ncbi:putative metallopeptidase [Thermofilum pendens]|uniref:Metallopeptidase-like protein n=1 Tax=Thermofilum pendens (strain DSM 2475 / Hrk 5) TaxID=368408 RepID=A1RW62_THEPD|nr:putative metallopeptidase [Thermofilum pendens]ABL77442.1 metallopeptidase-like protein [Thermofilum pendens Hrk 5]